MRYYILNLNRWHLISIQPYMLGVGSIYTGFSVETFKGYWWIKDDMGFKLVAEDAEGVRNFLKRLNVKDYTDLCG